jgi:alkanesulfonate monooxygenase SsuD/methylene tetrahydromethanopterin reductase-like flavin-dependent oxidoreductase (luciferase family)
MRIGLFTAVQWSAEENPGAFLKALREQVRSARDNGFSSLFVGQHLLTGPMGMFQTNPLLGHLVADAAGMQIGPGVLLLSMMNPVLAAEEAATIDWLADGNYVLGAGLGYRPEEFQAMGVAKHERVGRLIEGLEVIKRLWTEDSVTYQGRYFQLDDAKASVRPKQSPRRQSGSVATSSRPYDEPHGSPMPGASRRRCPPGPYWPALRSFAANGAGPASRKTSAAR